MMTPEQQYPSTDDCAAEGDDLVLECLKNARERVKLGHSTAVYIGAGGSVCALGAVFAEDGIADVEGVGVEARLYREDEDTGKWLHPGGQPAERALSQEAQEAIMLLNESALELIPESKQAELSGWAGPLEWVNQEWPNLGESAGAETQEIVLEIYDHAIERRGGR